MIDFRQLSRKRLVLSLRRLGGYLLPHWMLWAAVSCLLVVNLGWVLLNPRISLSLDTVSRIGVFLLGLLIAVLYWDWRRQHSDRLLEFLFKLACTMLFVGLLASQLALWNNLWMSLSMPIVDSALIALDRALGFDWNQYTAAVASSALNRLVLLAAYSWMAPLSILTIIIVALGARKNDRVNELAFLILTTGFACTVLSGLFPAQDPWFTIATPEVKSLLGGRLIPDWVDFFHKLRSDRPVVLFEKDKMFPLATFPSFHTCLALIMIWCSRGHPLGAIAGATAGLVTLAATPVWGTHYLVDMLAGGLVTLGAILIWSRMARGVVIS